MKCLDTDKVARLTKLIALVDKVALATDFVEIRLIGQDAIGGLTLRLKGKTVYSTVEDLPPFEFNIPDSIYTKIGQLSTALKTKLKAEVATA
jgi:hypothetical protein